MDMKKIEAKWQKKWQESGLFEAEPDEKKKKFFATFPYPYVNLSPHMGHFYTIMRVEAFARYKRLKGFNVLFPQGWHATGSPIISAAERVKEGEKKQIKLLKDEGFSDSEIKKFSKPETWIRIFGKKWMQDLKAMGLGIDWRRNFITTSMNPHYDRFVKWQFRKLKDKGLVSKGRHPVVWDPKTNMPVGDHDRTQGEGEVPQEFCLFKFSLEDGRKVVSATLRPETVMGITNLYVSPDATYGEIETKGEKWIVGEPIIEKLKNQDFDVRITGKVNGKDLIGKKAKFMETKFPILPAAFLDENYGTGIVHSVPSESADDLIALKELQENELMMQDFGLDEKEIKDIKPIEIFKTPGIGGNPAQHFLDIYYVNSQEDKEKLEKIKKELYKLTFNKSVFGSLYDKGEGFSENLENVEISKGQKIVRNDLLRQGKIELFYELTGKVVSRSLTECVVKIVKDQWFLKYGDGKWKKKVHEALKSVKLYPDVAREQFSHVIDWLNDWACAREYGLGTSLPFDEDWLIESLSDSTIYMAYYAIAHRIKDLDPEEVNDDFFDYVFLGKGEGKKKWESMKREFEYWYPVDFRNSGKDLIQNHLSFFLFNHAAIFPKKFWPRGIGLNGWVKVDNQKMSKSLGNVIPLKKMAEKFGSDVSRITILNGGEKLDDPNWDSEFAKSMKSKIEGIFDVVTENYGKGRKDVKNVDKWMESVSNKYVKEATEFMEETLFRSAIQKIFFDFGSLIRTYLSKTGDNPNAEIFDKSARDFLTMLSPFCPHAAEEIWSRIKGEGFVSSAEWPKHDGKKINEKFERQEAFVDKLVSDVVHLSNMLSEKKKKAGKAYVYVLPGEKDAVEENVETIKKRVNLDVEIFSVNDAEKHDPQNKSEKVKPGRPGIYLE